MMRLYTDEAPGLKVYVPALSLLPSSAVLEVEGGGAVEVETTTMWSRRRRVWRGTWSCSVASLPLLEAHRTPLQQRTDPPSLPLLLMSSPPAK